MSDILRCEAEVDQIVAEIAEISDAMHKSGHVFAFWDAIEDRIEALRATDDVMDSVIARLIDIGTVRVLRSIHDKETPG